MGGLDILKECVADGPLKEQWELDDDVAVVAADDTLQSRLNKLVNGKWAWFI